MTAQTKLIIITTDENLIQQFVTSKNEKTQIIDLPVVVRRIHLSFVFITN